MRAIHTLPLVAAILLAACGSNEDTTGKGMSPEQVADEAGDLVTPRPGQYKTTVELLEFDAPGMPDSAKQQMQQVFASGLAQGNTFCMTEEDAARNGPEQMVKNLAESDCEVKKFNVSGSDVVAEMQCAGQGGGTNTVKMQGEMTAESSSMTMDMSQELPNVGAVNMKMRVNSNRIGECS
ncbi:MAG: DUF3617 domain-containing protein [Porphyrobacter sp.]|nr:DUF3617 domain-containing protein [Porphyrobacter sp.]